MRDIIVTLMILGTLPMILKRPYIGILVWSWLSYMNPHKLAWGFAYSQPFAQIVAITFFLSLLFNKTKLELPSNFTIYCMFIFLGWMLLTSIMGFYPDRAIDYYMTVLKIQLFTFLTIAVIKDLERLNQLITVIVLSIGFFSIKGGVFTILTGGAFRVYGPPSTIIEENNALAVAILMIIPLMFYLRGVSEKKLFRWFWLFAILTSSASAIGSQSRGALVAIICVVLFFWIKSSSKLVTGLAMVVVMAAGYNFMPESWHQRMETTANYEEDASASSRLVSWEFNYNLANARFTGGGFKHSTKEMYRMYFGEVEKAYVAHSIYFSTLGDHGWFGLILFLLILAVTWRRLAVIISTSTKYPDSENLVLLAKMLQVSLIAYLSGGAFLNLAHFDLAWHIIAIAIIIERLYRGVLLEQKTYDALPSAKKGAGNFHSKRNELYVR